MDAETEFYKIQHSFTIKTLNKLEEKQKETLRNRKKCL